MQLPKSDCSNVLTLVTLFASILFMVACNTTTLADYLEPDIPTATPQADLPTATPEAVTSPSPTVEEVELEATPTGEFSTASHGSTRTVRPEELTGYIPNPYMGWQDTQSRNKRFDETVGYRRFNWSELNPAKGVYDWDRIEALRADMAQQGSAISFRVRTAQPHPGVKVRRCRTGWSTVAP